MQDKLPPLTSLQFLILSVLQDDERPGRDIRTALARFGARRSAAAFYQTMARLERARLIEGWYEQITVGDQAVTERRYRLRPAGSRQLQETRAFYERAASLAKRVSNA